MVSRGCIDIPSSILRIIAAWWAEAEGAATAKSVGALVPAGWYWSITTPGTINPSGYPSSIIRII